MPRSRSRSPKRTDRRRSRSRERKHRRQRRSRSRSPVPRYRSRSPVAPRRRSRSHSPRRRSPSPRFREPTRPQQEKQVVPEKPKIDPSQLEGLSEEDQAMMAVMGFAGFDSTKGKKVDGNEIYVSNIQRKRRYRQYMNRRGGFNRPLDFIA